MDIAGEETRKCQKKKRDEVGSHYIDLNIVYTKKLEVYMERSTHYR